MSRRFIGIVALAFLVALAPLASHAQQAKEKHETASAHADAPSPARRAASAAAGGPAAAAQTPAGGGNNLQAALERISQQIAEARETRESPRRSTAGTPAATGPARIKLVWRPTVIWPAEVGGTGASAIPPPADDGNRVTLIWAEPSTSATTDPLQTTAGITEITWENLTRCLGPLGCKAANGQQGLGNP